MFDKYYQHYTTFSLHYLLAGISLIKIRIVDICCLTTAQKMSFVETKKAIPFSEHRF